MEEIYQAEYIFTDLRWACLFYWSQEYSEI